MLFYFVSGSREDVKRMAALFETVFGFKIEYHQDKLKQEIIDIYREKTNELRSSPVQRFFSVLLSHGDDVRPLSAVKL